MGPSLAIAIYLTVWWVVFLSILPLGVTSYAEAGIKPVDGGDPAAPVDPKLKRKFITTTWVAAIFFAVIWSALYFHWIPMPHLRGGA